MNKLTDEQRSNLHYELALYSFEVRLLGLKDRHDRTVMMVDTIEEMYGKEKFTLQTKEEIREWVESLPLVFLTTIMEVVSSIFAELERSAATRGDKNND